MTAPARRFIWNADQEKLLRERYPDTVTAKLAELIGCNINSIYRKANLLGLKKSAAFLASAECGRLHISDGTNTRFKRGGTPWNKGKKLPGHGCKETQFKPGHLGGRAAQIYRPIGSERISRDGYLERKIHDGLPMQSRWRAVHLLIWEAANGPIPPSHAIVFKDGNKQNIVLDNLEMITRQALMRRNSMHNYGPEIARLHQLQGAITRQINRRLGKKRKAK